MTPAPYLDSLVRRRVENTRPSSLPDGIGEGQQVVASGF